jgi:hypothetical protein
MGNAVEASSQRIRDHLRRPIPGREELLNENTRNTFNEIVPGTHFAGTFRESRRYLALRAFNG